MDGIILPMKWLEEKFPEEAVAVKELMMEAGWQDFHGILMPSAEMLEKISNRRFIITIRLKKDEK